MEINQILEILKQIKNQITNNEINGYKNLLYLYFNLIQLENNAFLLEVYNSFIVELF
jgi:hypothetical protein